MPYTALSLSLAWLFALAIVVLAVSGLVTGTALAALVLAALVMPAMILRRVPSPVAVVATTPR